MVVLSVRKPAVFQKHLLSVTSKCNNCTKNNISTLVQNHCSSIHEKFPPTTRNWPMVIYTLIEAATDMFPADVNTILTICSDVYESSGWKSVVHRLYFGIPEINRPDITITEAI